jgi:hypothetical protein
MQVKDTFVRCVVCGALIAAPLAHQHACEEHGQQLVCTIEPVGLHDHHTEHDVTPAAKTATVTPSSGQADDMPVGRFIHTEPQQF